MSKLGIDLGSSSIGWALKKDNKIRKKGVVTFDSGMMKGQTGGYTSPTRDRREARSKRRLIQARKYRKWALLEILIENEKFVPLPKSEFELWSKYQKGVIRRFPKNKSFLKWLACDFTYQGGIKYRNPYELRVKALDEKLSPHEFGRALYHLVQRRGYKDIGETDKETESQIKRRDDSGFQKALNENRSIAEALKSGFIDKKKRARNQYPYREEYKKELELICKSQGYEVDKKENGEYLSEFVQKIWKAIIWQRPLRSQKGTIGKCTLESQKSRCPISHPIFEIFRAWQFINTIKYYDDNEQKQFISDELREKLFSEFFLKKDDFKFEDIRKFLDKQFQKKRKYNYPINTKTGKYETSVSGMPICKSLIEIFGEDAKFAISEMEKYNIGNAPKMKNGYSVYDLWHIIFEFDESHLENLAQSKLNIQNITVKRKGVDVSISPLILLKNKFNKSYADLSLKAMGKIIPFLKEGFLYNEAVVLAKIPDLLGQNWNDNREQIIELIRSANDIYTKVKQIVAITNSLIDRYKGLEYPNIFAYKDYDYTLVESDEKDIKDACERYFGENTWGKLNNKDEIISEVGKLYQEFFFDTKRAFKQASRLTDIFHNLLKSEGIELNGTLYHHSDRENIYLKKCVDSKTGKTRLPIHKATGIEILPEPRIDSIKNPMFNKSMSILRKLINELILNADIDSDTEIVVELARELNDNNMRAAIERYQNERKNKREKIREFLAEFKSSEVPSLNVEENIPLFEMWTEQTFEETEDETRNKIKNVQPDEVFKEKDSIRRYELWMEQKGQCIYTGRMISISQLFSREVDIEHTVPRSILPDNTMANQTVCYNWYNTSVKGKKIPLYCENYSEDKTLQGKFVTRIQPRLENWKETRDRYKKLFEDNRKARGNEDENKKNSRIQAKHYFKMHYDYWRDKIERFEAKEIKDSWARRQLTDTQMISKYAREFLKTYFKKVAVQKGTVTADFRKIYGFQEEDEIKSRNKHTHHAIDAAVLTLIPVNSSRREEILKRYFEDKENGIKVTQLKPFEGFNPQELIRNIENSTLIVNLEKDNLVKQTKKAIRKRGKIQYATKNGKYILDKDEKNVKMYAKGDSVRSTLFKQTFLGKIKDVERDRNQKPLRDEKGNWKYKTGNDEYIFTERKPIADVLSKIDDIVDPNIREMVRSQKNNDAIKDAQGNTIRHVRIKVRAGQVVKERVNYRSKHEYKNFYYSAAGSLPYAIMLQKPLDGKVERKLIPIASFEIAKVFKERRKFDIDYFIQENYPNFISYDKKLLKVGQRVLVLNDDSDYQQIKDFSFQKNRLYRITQFGEGSIYLKYHLEAMKDDEIDKAVKIKKDELVSEFDKKFGLPEIEEDLSIQDIKERRKKYEDDRYKFVGLKDFRFNRLLPFMGEEEVNNLRKNLSVYRKQSTSIEAEGNTPLLKINKADGWNFLYEGYDFVISVTGELNFLEDY